VERAGEVEIDEDIIVSCTIDKRGGIGRETSGALVAPSLQTISVLDIPHHRYACLKL